MGLPKYFNFDEIKDGTVLFEKAEYIGTVDGKFGAQLRFRDLDGQDYVVGGGSLNWRLENGDIDLGRVFRLTYKGKETLEKGNYAGRPVKVFEIEEYTTDELADWKFLNPPGTARSEAAATDEKSQASESEENLDGLE